LSTTLSFTSTRPLPLGAVGRYRAALQSCGPSSPAPGAVTAPSTSPPRCWSAPLRNYTWL